MQKPINSLAAAPLFLPTDPQFSGYGYVPFTARGHNILFAYCSALGLRKKVVYGCSASLGLKKFKFKVSIRKFAVAVFQTW